MDLEVRRAGTLGRGVVWKGQEGTSGILVLRVFISCKINVIHFI